MATIHEIEQRVWQSVLPDLAFNPEAAIPKKWRALRAANTPIGVPVTAEEPIDSGHVAQGFTSGHLLVWTGGDVVELR
jgi:hypothetical protein